MNIPIGFIKTFACKYLGTVAIERIIIILLKELVDRTESKIDNKIYKAVFDQIGGAKDES